MEIEEVAARSPEKIHKQAIHPGVGWQDYQSRWIAFRLGLGEPLVGKLGELLPALARCYQEMDCALLEVNPLVSTEDGRLLALVAEPDPAAARDFDRGRRLALHEPLGLPGERRAEGRGDAGVPDLLQRRPAGAQRREQVAELLGRGAR